MSNVTWTDMWCHGDVFTDIASLPEGPRRHSKIKHQGLMVMELFYNPTCPGIVGCSFQLLNSVLYCIFIFITFSEMMYLLNFLMKSSITNDHLRMKEVSFSLASLCFDRDLKGFSRNVNLSINREFGISVNIIFCHSA